MARLSRFVCQKSLNTSYIAVTIESVFGSEGDFAAYIHWLAECSSKYMVAIHAWVFMTNHVHLLVTPEPEDGISRMMQALGRH